MTISARQVRISKVCLQALSMPLREIPVPSRIFPCTLVPRRSDFASFGPVPRATAGDLDPVDRIEEGKMESFRRGTPSFNHRVISPS